MEKGKENNNILDHPLNAEGKNVEQSNNNRTSESNSRDATTTSYTSYTSYSKQIEDFFYDDPSLPYKPLPEHSMQESPCCHIIGKNKNLYFCKLHPGIKSVHLDTIEQHCKYKDPNIHKSEILRLTTSITKRTE